MVAAGLNFGGAELLLAWDDEAVLGGVHGDAHAPKVLGNGFDAIGFLDTQLGGVSHGESVFGNGAQNGQYWDLVNECGGSGAFDSPSADTRASDLQRAD